MAACSVKNLDAIPGQYDVKYGQGKGEKLDLYGAAGDYAGKPVFAFIHGGYWQVGRYTVNALARRGPRPLGLRPKPRDGFAARTLLVLRPQTPAGGSRPKPLS